MFLQDERIYVEFSSTSEKEKYISTLILKTEMKHFFKKEI